MRRAKTKALISFAVTAKLICVFVFAYAKIRFSHDAAQVVAGLITYNRYNIFILINTMQFTSPEMMFLRQIFEQIRLIKVPNLGVIWSFFPLKCKRGIY